MLSIFVKNKFEVLKNRNKFHVRIKRVYTLKHRLAVTKEAKQFNVIWDPR